MLLSLNHAEAADPWSAAYSWDGENIFWLLHVSDAHIGSEWHDENERFEWFLFDVAPVVQPTLIVNSGDLCDGSLAGIPTSGQSDSEWGLYRGLLDLSGMTTDIYVDIPGNHDAYGDKGMTHYLKWSLNGQTFDSLSRELTLSFPFGEYYIYGISTPGDDGRIFVESPGLSIAELAEARQNLLENQAADLIFVFGHHPLGGFERSNILVETLSEHEAFYFHGHRHRHSTYLYDDVLSGEVNSLGKQKESNVALIAVDNNAVSYVAVDNEDPWPFIVITTPSQAKLSDGKRHPYYYEVCSRGINNPVRALVFDSDTVEQVTFTIGDYGPYDMERDEKEPALWHGVFNATGMLEEEVVLTVEAVGSQVRQASRAVMLADVPCPEPFEAPEDGGADDTPTDDDDDSEADTDVEDEDTGGFPTEPEDTDISRDPSADSDPTEPKLEEDGGSETLDVDSDDSSCGCFVAGQDHSLERLSKLGAIIQKLVF